MLVYNIVIAAETDADAASWAANKLDPEVMSIRGLFQSAFLPHWILRVESPLSSTDYVSLAFEGSLNSEMRDEMSPVAWWNKTEYTNKLDHQKAIGKIDAPARPDPGTRKPRGR